MFTSVPSVYQIANLPPTFGRHGQSKHNDSGVTTDKDSHSMTIRRIFQCTVSEPGS
ncbi:hypothetical protein [Heliothis virescens ascovirus 3e]|uniref:Uncharacterized protein n=1 Tax=Heliothis virescens ascovirus 3e TaxID=260797 RepID=A4KXE3_HVAVE|nr:hypothetical protein HVAV3e_gp087 [Heliothis virescens ascovirus 3e]ABO37274.1 hypothetical protein [Heliothis virescens ascovirus 3e]